MSLMQARRVPLLVTTPYVAPPAGVTDTFTAADGTNNNGRAADSGQTWTVLSGSASISGNRMKIPSFASSSSKSIIDSSLADCTVQADVDFANFCGLIFRATDANNLWKVLGNGPGNTIFLKKVVAGSETDVTQLNPQPAGANPRTMKVVLAGSLIKVYDGATLLLTATDSFNATATKHGLMTDGTQFNDQFFDNFSVA